MSEHARRLKFPLRVGTADNPGDAIAVLEADGSFHGDIEKMESALRRMEGRRDNAESLLMWLLLCEMKRQAAMPPQRVNTDRSTA